MKRNFTEREILDAIQMRHPGKQVCIDQMEDARHADTLDEACEILLLDTAFWDGELLGP